MRGVLQRLIMYSDIKVNERARFHQGCKSPLGIKRKKKRLNCGPSRNDSGSRISGFICTQRWIVCAANKAASISTDHLTMMGDTRMKAWQKPLNVSLIRTKISTILKSSWIKTYLSTNKEYYHPNMQILNTVTHQTSAYVNITRF